VTAPPAAAADAHSSAAATSSPSSLTGRATDMAERLRLLLDPVFLAEAGWDPALQVLNPPGDHPQLGYRTCVVVGCTTPSDGTLIALCGSCRTHYRRSGQDLASFIASGPRKRYAYGQVACAVAGCARPCRYNQRPLCRSHAAQRKGSARWLSFEAFLAHPDVRPLPPAERCRVDCCVRTTDEPSGLCSPHQVRWRRQVRVDPDTDLDRWCQTQPPIRDGCLVVLRGLAPLVQLEVLYGLQVRVRRGCTTSREEVRAVCYRLRDATPASVADLDSNAIQTVGYRRLLRDIQIAVTRALTPPEVEQRKDRWDMGIFGLGNATLDFTKLTQSWLRAAMQHWVQEEHPKRRGADVPGVLAGYIRSLVQLSESLAHRPDHGDDPAGLGRGDVVAFLNRQAHLEAIGKRSAKLRAVDCGHVARILRDCRAQGLTRPGQAMAGLPDDFALRPSDIPRPPSDDGPGRALPTEILEQLIEALPQLEAASGRHVRVAVELLMATGRRPREICVLPYDCLDRDTDSKHALVYTDFKNNRTGRRLPIDDATAALVLQQQQLVRAQFPDTPIEQLVLLPRKERNPHGTSPQSLDALRGFHRSWVNTLGPMRLATGSEFNMAAVILYAYRHSFAQRHADAGTPVDVLCDLMCHDNMGTTQRYYRVTAKRTRAAVDKLAAFQFDGRGNRVWREAIALLEHEHQRRAVGQVAVPFGICTEPSNVKAGGHACPFRFRCPGCGHFRSDPSYLPELRGYLDMLLRNRERVRAATELEEWARAEAMPSDHEINRVRALIRRAETDLEQLSDDERRQIDEACRVVRATRQTVHLGMPTIRPADLDPTLPTNQGELA
jgi:site-specific recombinase XerD